MRLRNILKNINVINIALIIILTLFIFYKVIPAYRADVEYVVPPVNNSTQGQEVKTLPPLDEKEIALSDYMIVAENNLFHPERKLIESKQTPTAPPGPKPDFVLYGTIISGDVKVAFMEDKKARIKNRKNRKGEAKQVALKQGDSLSGYILKEIETDKVVMGRGEEAVTVYLEGKEDAKNVTTAEVLPPPSIKVETSSEARDEAPPEQPLLRQPLTTPPVERKEEKKPLSPEQIRRAKDALMKLFQRGR